MNSSSPVYTTPAFFFQRHGGSPPSPVPYSPQQPTSPAQPPAPTAKAFIPYGSFIILGAIGVVLLLSLGGKTDPNILPFPPTSPGP